MTTAVGEVKYECNYCGEVCEDNATRLRFHLLADGGGIVHCPSDDAKAMRTVHQAQQEELAKKQDMWNKEHGLTHVASPPRGAKRPSNARQNTIVKAFNQAEQVEIENLLGEWFCENHMPWIVVERKTTKTLMKKLNETAHRFRLPTRQKLSGEVLDRLVK